MEIKDIRAMSILELRPRPDGIDVTQFTGYTNQIRHDIFCPYINIQVEREIVAEDQDNKMNVNQSVMEKKWEAALEGEVKRWQVENCFWF